MHGDGGSPRALLVLLRFLGDLAAVASSSSVSQALASASVTSDSGVEVPVGPNSKSSAMLAVRPEACVGGSTSMAVGVAGVGDGVVLIGFGLGDVTVLVATGVGCGVGDAIAEGGGAETLCGMASPWVSGPTRIHSPRWK